MSLVTKCDKCGRIESSPKGWAMLEPIGLQGYADDLDLCPECYMDVYDFIIGKDKYCHCVIDEDKRPAVCVGKLKSNGFNIFEEGDSNRV